MNSSRVLFLETCNDVVAALADPRIAAVWDEPSVLEGQTVGSVAAHVARGSWTALQYLDDGVPTRAIDFDSAADYFAKLLDAATPEGHAGIRQRGAEAAEAGPESVRQLLATQLAELNKRLDTEPEGRLVTVYGDNVMALDHYLGTRLVEQVVHLDDLSRSVGGEPFPVNAAAQSWVIACGADIGRRRLGATTMVRALFRDMSRPSIFGDD